jgi:hypothetical protein
VREDNRRRKPSIRVISCRTKDNKDRKDRLTDRKKERKGKERKGKGKEEAIEGMGMDCVRR